MCADICKTLEKLRVSLPVGGGRQVIRCEISLDCGKSWRLAEIQTHEEPTVYGKFWCWVFWELRVPTVDILRAPELRCRAVDSSNNSQPEGCVARRCCMQVLE